MPINRRCANIVAK